MTKKIKQKRQARRDLDDVASRRTSRTLIITSLITVSGVMATAGAMMWVAVYNKQTPDPSAPEIAVTSSSLDSPSPEQPETTPEFAAEEPEPIEPVYTDVKLKLDEPLYGDANATLIDFDTDPPSTRKGRAADGYDMYYDQERNNTPSAYFKVNLDGDARLGLGPDSLPSDPAECVTAVATHPLPGYLPQPRDQLMTGGGYCLITDQGNIVWFNVLSMEGDYRSYSFTFLVTMWQGS